MNRLGSWFATVLFAILLVGPSAGAQNFGPADAQEFMQMVRSGYRPVYRPSRFTFGEVTQEREGRPTQQVTIIDENGKAWSALYTFERQPDGSWKIIGCTLVESAGGEA
jgi:hypothetical protein